MHASLYEIDTMRYLSLLKRLFISLLIVFGVNHAAFAHRPNDSKLELTLSESAIQGEVRFQVDDLEWVLGIDDNRDKKLTWGEFRHNLPRIQRQFVDQIAIQRSGTRCDLKSELTEIKIIADRTYALFSLNAACPDNTQQLTVDANYLQVVDPQHQLFLTIHQNDKTSSSLLTRNNPSVVIKGNIQLLDSIQTFVNEGIWHIFLGYDHILFILTLIFSALIGLPIAQQKQKISQLLIMISSFTAAHSITLIASALDWIRLPSQWVEAAIAATVIVAALNVITRWVTERLWSITFSFGLIHGMGFASALRELEIPKDNFISALLSFNLGVEIGQLVILAVIIPLLFLLAKNSFRWQQRAIHAGSLIILCCGVIWFIERTGNVAIFRILTG